MKKNIQKVPELCHNFCGTLFNKTCDHLFGEQHTTRHRVFTGVFIMVAGVLISKATNHYVVHIFADTIGYLLHGIGGYPIIEFLVKRYNS